jgi:hypothetical protein
MNPFNLEAIKEEFDRSGYVKLDQVLNPEELELLRKETGVMVSRGWEGQTPAHHYFHAPDPQTGKEVFYRVQFLFTKAVFDPNAYLPLLGHPVILRIVEKLLGEHFIVSGEIFIGRAGKP